MVTVSCRANFFGICRQSLREPRNRSHFGAPSNDKLYWTVTPAGPSRCIPDFQVVRGTVGPVEASPMRTF